VTWLRATLSVAFGIGAGMWAMSGPLREGDLDRFGVVFVAFTAGSALASGLESLQRELRDRREQAERRARLAALVEPKGTDT
jgi:hypothetical protein